MDSLFLILELLALALIVYWVGKPLVSNEFAGSKAQWLADELSGLEENNKEAVLSTLNEIEFDYATGKLADDDYQVLKKKYQVMAVQLLEEEEGEITSSVREETYYSTEEDIEASKDVDVTDNEIDKEIEEELKRLKAGRGTP